VTKTRSLFFRAFGGYLFSQTLGGAINVMVFMVISVALKQSLVVGVVMGTISGLIVNYSGARRVLLHGKTRI
jgi:putative flippase GtrA